MTIFFSSNHKHFMTNKKKTYFLGNWCFTKHNLLKKKKKCNFLKKN